VPEREPTRDEIAARAFWSGTITFGLVSIPVNLFAANRSSRVSLRMVSPEGTPLARRYFASRDGKPLESDDIVRGYEVEKDRYVVVEDDELERLAPERTRDIDLRLFVPVTQIDPMHFERAYYLTPAGNSTKAYRLLARVMEDAHRAGIATFVMRAKEYLVAILAENGILRAETLRFADEVRTAEDVGLPAPEKPPAALVTRIEKAMGKLAKSKMDPGELADRSAERLLKVVEKKRRAGKDVVHREVEEDGEPRDVIDIMSILKRSLQGEDRDAAPTKGSAKAAAPGAQSRAQLYARAQELDIPGRSGMSKDELVEAIRRSA
jgi:DNA end-binding protein Ku